MLKSFVLLLGDALRFALCAALISAGYIACIFLAAALGPVLGAEYAPSTDPAKPLIYFEEDPRTGDWFSNAKLAVRETGTRSTPTPVLLPDGTPTGETVIVTSQAAALTPEKLALEGAWRAGYIALAMLAGCIAARWLLSRFAWSHRAMRSLRTKPPKANPQLLVLAVAVSFGMGFYSCGLLHEVRRFFGITDLDEFLPFDIAVTLGSLLGAAYPALLVLVRRRYPLTPQPVCWNCDYNMTALPSPICPECGASGAPASPAPRRELRIVGVIVAAVFGLATVVLVLRPGTAAYHRGIVDSIPNSTVAFPPGQPIRITTTHGTWLLDCNSTPATDENGMPVLLDATCTLTHEDGTGQATVTPVEGALATQSTGPALHLGDGRLQVDVYRWAESPQYFRIFVQGKATIEPIKRAKN